MERNHEYLNHFKENIIIAIGTERQLKYLVIYMNLTVTKYDTFDTCGGRPTQLLCIYICHNWVSSTVFISPRFFSEPWIILINVSQSHI